MNKIQLNAALMVAEMKYGAEPSEINKAELEKAQLAFDSFVEPEVSDEATGTSETVDALSIKIGGPDKSEDKTGVEKKAAVPAEKTAKAVDKKK